MRTAALILVLGALRSAPSLEATLEAVFSYVVAYEARLTELIADEAMQQSRPAAFAVAAGRTQRKWTSEIAFMRLPGDGPWLGYRNVIVVDGRRVREDSARLQTLLARGPNEEKRALDLALASARFNLGLPRTTNMPTLPLEFVHPRHRDRLTFKLEGMDRVNGRSLRRLSFQEHVRPTLIRDPEGPDILSRGSVWIEEGTGRIFEAEVRMVAGDDPSGPEASLRVSFAPQPGFDILLPVRMRETFPLGSGLGTSDARYSNFRRFATTARLVPQP
jgi:hypothetical protein